MPKYVAFLRAINLGSSRKFPKADIVAATEAAGGADVQTHINTGNVCLTTSLRSRAKVEAALEAAYEERAGFVVPTIVFTPAELVAIAEDARELTGARPDLERHYVYLLKGEPAATLVKAVEEHSDAVNEVVVRGRAAFARAARSRLRGRRRRPLQGGEVPRRRRHQPQLQRGHDPGRQVVLVDSPGTPVPPWSRDDREPGEGRSGSPAGPAPRTRIALADTPWVTVVWNDPVNLMSYVTFVFQKHFGYGKKKAEKLMMEVHEDGRSVVSSGSREEMERDVQAMHEYGLWATLSKAE